VPDTGTRVVRATGRSSDAFRRFRRCSAGDAAHSGRVTQGFDVAALQVALAPDGYSLVPGVDAVPPLHETSFRDYGKIGAMVVVLGAIALALSISD
jgi:hypothetical protein